MKPNDMPLICLPLGLCDADVATLLDFLYDLTEALERHYTGELMRRNYPRLDAPRAARIPISTIHRSENPVVHGKTPPCPKTASHRQNTAGLRRR